MYYLLLFADWHETWGRTKQTIPLPLEYGTWHRRLGYEATFIALAICLSCSGSHRRILSEARGCIASPIFCVWILVCRRRDEWFTCCRKTRRRNGSYRQTAAPEDWAPDDDRQTAAPEDWAPDDVRMLVSPPQTITTTTVSCVSFPSGLATWLFGPRTSEGEGRIHRWAMGAIASSSQDGQMPPFSLTNVFW